MNSVFQIPQKLQLINKYKLRKNKLNVKLNFKMMKKLFTFLSLFVLIGMSATVFAQSSGTAPYPGAKHTYQVNSGSNGGHFYEWKVFKNVSDVLTDVTSSDVTISAISGGTINDAKIYIQWHTDLIVDDVYFVQVTEYDNASSATGCSNTKDLKVTITQSNFNLEITAAATSCYDGDVVVSSSSGSPVYTHGSATLSYVVTPTGLGASETYNFTVAPSVPTGWTAASPTITSGNGNITTGGAVTTTDNSAITIQYVVTKDNSNSNGETTDVADFSSKVTIQTGTGFSSLGVPSNETGSQDATTAVSRPHTTDIQALD